LRGPRKKILDFITTSNAFEVMGHFKRLGILTGEDIRRAAKLSRAEWLRMMKEKTGAIEHMPEFDHADEEETE